MRRDRKRREKSRGFGRRTSSARDDGGDVVIDACSLVYEAALGYRSGGCIFATGIKYRVTVCSPLFIGALGEHFITVLIHKTVNFVTLTQEFHFTT